MKKRKMSVAKLVGNATIKRSAFAALFALMTLSAQGQNQRVTVELKNKPLSGLFSTLEKQAKVSIDFAVNQVDVKQNVTVNMQNQRIEDVLKKVLPALGYAYEFKGDHVIITSRAALGKMKQITGVVMDANNEPLMGANIAVPETGTIAITDLDGKYTIFAPENASLVYTYIGFAPQEIKIKGRKNFNIFLAEDQKALDEVVVTGFQTISRERASGAAVIVNKEKLNQIKSPDIVSNLEGLVPGLNTQGGISIRGTSSFSLSSQPLIVIDGMPVENISNFYAGTSTTGLGLVNPDDIESVTVLKDAAATSLYGVRAANGVIVVTTKKGTSQKPLVSFSANYYITPDAGLDYMKYASTADILNYEVEYMTNDPIYKQDPLEYFDMLNSSRSPGYVTKVKDLYYQKALGNLTQSDIDAQLNMLRRRDYRQEYMDRFAKSSFTQDYNLSISQGSDFAQTYFSARFQDNRPNSIDATSNRIAMNLNNTFNFAKWVKLNTGISVNIDNSKNKNLSYIDYDNNNYMLTEANRFMPYDQIIGDDGQRSVLYPFNMYRSQEVGENSDFQQMGYNVYDDLESGSWYKNRDIYLKFLANAEFKIIKDLTFDLRFQYEHINGKTETYSSVKSYEMRELINRYTSVHDDGYNTQAIYNVPKGGKLNESDKQLQNLNLRGQFNYSSVYNEKHALSALAGFEMRENKIRYLAQDRYGYDDQLLSYQFVDWASLAKTGVIGLLSDVTQTLAPDQGVGEAIHRYISGYFNAGYTYDGRYSATASVRMDQADLFGTDPKYRYRPLWSVGGSWNVSNEAFMCPYSWIDMLKLRVTYGITGNVDQNSTPFLIGSMYVSSETGGNLTEVVTPPNKLLRWEKTSTFNFGIDFAAWNRLNASVDVYKRYSSDLLAPKRYDPSMGFAEGWVNNGAMSNKGVEFTGSYDWIKTKNWRFSSQLTAAYNKNKIENIDYEPSNALDLLKYPNQYYRTGTSRGTMYAYKYGGLNEVGDPIVFDENGNAVSNDPVRSIDAVYAVGQMAPKWQGMLNLSLQYKNFELFTRFVYYTGHSMRYDVMPLYKGIDGGEIHRDIANRWTPSNQGLIPAIGRYGDDSNRGDHWKFADEHILTASYIRARNIGLTYTVPQSFLQKIGFKSAVLRAQVDNPFYIAFNGEGIDPEAYQINEGKRSEKIMPTYTFGVNVSF